MRIGLVKRLLNGLLIASCVLAGCGHSPSPSLQGEGRVPFDPESYPDLLDLHYTPGKMEKCQGWFSDEGSWFGFTLPETTNPKHGFCGPFDLDERHRDWISDAILEVEIEPDGQTGISTTESHYYPGELRLGYHSGDVPVKQKPDTSTSTPQQFRTRVSASPVKRFSTRRRTRTRAAGSQLRLLKHSCKVPFAPFVTCESACSVKERARMEGMAKSRNRSGTATMDQKAKGANHPRECRRRK